MALDDLVTRADLERFIRQRFPDDKRPQRVKPPRYLTADIPSAADLEGEIIYVPDAAAGAKFQGSNGSAWVNLG